MAKATMEYSVGDEEDVHEETSIEEATSASTSLTSLFESPNDNLSIDVNKCLMARGTEVTPPSKPISKTNNLMGDLDSLKIK
jgi:hypothetical protein